MAKTGQLYIFGDSLSDDGASAVQVQDEPIDIFFAGRASNGLVWHENIRNDLAVAPAATSISQAPNAQGFLSGSDVNGINFAHSGAVSDSDSKPTLPGAVQQAEGFAALVAAGDIPTPDEQDVFVIWIGGNDFLDIADANFLELFQIFNLGETVVDNIETTVETLRATGASNFMILGQPTVGGAFLGELGSDVPFLVSLWNGITGDFNEDLEDFTEDLNATTGQSALFIDIADLVDQIEDDPASFGFSNVTSDIFSDEAPLDDQSYFSVDGIHPTGAGHKAIADFVVQTADAAGFDLTALAGNVLPGSDRDDTLTGSDGPDTITGGAGDDTITGQGGRDVAVYAGAQTRFTLELGADVRLTDRGGTEGQDTLSGLETLVFDDTPFALEKFEDAAQLNPIDFANLTEVYLSYFDRAPDALGLTFWAHAFANGMSLHHIAEQFALSPEAQALYPQDLASGDLVTAVYQNTLGRAPDDAGFAFWTFVLDSGSVSRGQFVLSVLEGARAAAPDNASAAFIEQQEEDRSYLSAKTSVGVYYAAVNGLSDVENARTVMALYDGTQDSFGDTFEATNAFAEAARASDGSGEFIINIVGAGGDPFFGV